MCSVDSRFIGIGPVARLVVGNRVRGKIRHSFTVIHQGCHYVVHLLNWSLGGSRLPSLCWWAWTASTPLGGEGTMMAVKVRLRLRLKKKKQKKKHDGDGEGTSDLWSSCSHKPSSFHTGQCRKAAAKHAPARWICTRGVQKIKTDGCPKVAAGVKVVGEGDGPVQERDQSLGTAAQRQRGHTPSTNPTQTFEQKHAHQICTCPRGSWFGGVISFWEFCLI